MGAWPLLDKDPVIAPSVLSKVTTSPLWDELVRTEFVIMSTGDWNCAVHKGAARSQSSGPYTEIGQINCQNNVLLILDGILSESLSQGNCCNCNNGINQLPILYIFISLLNITLGPIPYWAVATNTMRSLKWKTQPQFQFYASNVHLSGHSKCHI